MTVPAIPDLAELDLRYRAAFAAGRNDDLRVIGYGEITSVVSWPVPEGLVAVKRLPVFTSSEQTEKYLDLLGDYLARLRGAGVAVVPTSSHVIPGDGGTQVVYLVQEEIPADRVGIAMLRGSGPESAAVFEEICAAAVRANAAGIGFDAQVSNFVRLEDGLGYLDVTTPLLRDESGADRLDAAIFVASLPWLVRRPVRRFIAPAIIAEYFDLRIVLLNLLANLHKERLGGLLPMALEAANRHLAQPIERREVDRYYRKDALMWEVLQRLRRLDRAWRVKVRRRPYPVLLPGKTKR